MSLGPDQAPLSRGLVLLNKAEKLVVDLGPAIDKVPRHQRYRYAVRLEDALWELVSRIIEAAASGQKARFIGSTNMSALSMRCCVMARSASCCRRAV